MPSLAGRSIEEKRRDIFPFAVAHCLDAVDNGPGIEAARAAINAYGKRAVTGLPLGLFGCEQAIKQGKGEVVDNFPPHIFKRIKCRGFARPGHAGDQQNADRARFARHAAIIRSILIGVLM
jgi:hypothetical protein